MAHWTRQIDNWMCQWLIKVGNYWILLAARVLLCHANVCPAARSKASLSSSLSVARCVCECACECARAHAGPHVYVFSPKRTCRNVSVCWSDDLWVSSWLGVCVCVLLKSSQTSNGDKNDIWFLDIRISVSYPDTGRCPKNPLTDIRIIIISSSSSAYSAYPVLGWQRGSPNSEFQVPNHGLAQVSVIANNCRQTSLRIQPGSRRPLMI